MNQAKPPAKAPAAAQPPDPGLRPFRRGDRVIVNRSHSYGEPPNGPNVFGALDKIVYEGVVEVAEEIGGQKRMAFIQFDLKLAKGLGQPPPPKKRWIATEHLEHTDGMG